MTEPDFVYVLPTGAQPVDDDGIGPTPIEIEDIEHQLSEMREAAAAAAEEKK